MNRTWQVQAGQLLCHWSDVGQRLEYRPRWMQEISEVPSGYLPVLPDFGRHSPFCGAYWFQPDAVPRNWE
jgi:hypothetical protein